MNKYKTLIIFDWDDTLFPTTWLVKNNIELINEQMQNKYIVTFSKLDNLLYKLLSSITKYGKVIIVTNAVYKWIDISLIMLPNTKQLIKRNIPIISAQDHYQEKYPGKMEYWKKMTFQTLTFNHFNTYPFQNIISIGDAEHEFNALINLYNENSVTKKKLLKTLRFIREPSFDALIDQLEVLNNCHLKIVSSKKHMDLFFKS